MLEGTLKHALDEVRAVKLCFAAVPIEKWMENEVSFRTLRNGFQDSVLLLAQPALIAERTLVIIIRYRTAGEKLPC